MGIKDNFKATGYCTLSNYGGFEIEISNCGDGARLKYYDKVMNWQEIKYNIKGAYVSFNNRKIYLSNFMRIR